jgi:hypothetical protein
MSYIPYVVGDTTPFNEEELVRNARLLNLITASHDAFGHVAVARMEHANGRADEAAVRSAEGLAKSHKEQILVALGFGYFGS